MIILFKKKENYAKQISHLFHLTIAIYKLFSLIYLCRFIAFNLVLQTIFKNSSLNQRSKTA
jgi:hypothetical protein